MSHSSSKPVVILSSAQNSEKANEMKEYLNQFISNVSVLSKINSTIQFNASSEYFVICTGKEDFSTFSSYLPDGMIYTCIPVWWECPMKKRPLILCAKKGLTPSWLGSEE